GEIVKFVKFRRRKHYRKHQGHSQWFTDVKISGISA
ncbi:bL21 family ribosomal protein, partial [Escherichia coli]|nr:bL21 family ribosomal protein [Escherichia coli]